MLDMSYSGINVDGQKMFLLFLLGVSCMPVAIDSGLTPSR